jgi:hypothetical protein
MIRKILDQLSFLTESTGLANRKPGDVFADPEGNEIRFQSIDFFPPGGGKYQTSEETQKAIDIAIKSIGVTPIETNWFRGSTRSFGIAQFQDAQGNPLAFIRYFDKELSADPRGNYWDNQGGIPGYRYQGKAAVKTQSNATPQDILTQLDDLTPADILRQVEEKFPGSNLVTVTQHLVSGGELPFTFMRPQEMDISAFQDYFCELLQPIALQTGQFEGEAAAAALAFLPDGGFSDTTINFSTSKTEGLSDSIMTAPDGRSIKVSSKGGKGAPASVVNILNAYDELQRTANGRKLTKKLINTVEILNTIKNTGQAEGPLVLAQQFGIITEKDAEFIRALKQVRPLPLDSFKDVSIRGKQPSKNLVKLAKERNTKEPMQVNFFYHLMASVAFKVADYVNNKTDFGKDTAVILNNSALIQVYTKVTARGQQWTLQKFGSKWPGSIFSPIALDPSKSYYSTGIKQKFTFDMKPRKKSLDDPQSAHADISDPDTEFKRSKVKAAQPESPLGSEKTLGRRRRQRANTDT